MIEVGVVIDTSGNPVFWHLPRGRTSVSLPDSRTLWEVLWAQHTADTLLGFAHSHPGSGVPGPSYTDVTTFAAVEAALGRRITWWITSSDHVVAVEWSGPDKHSYQATLIPEPPAWVVLLREASESNKRPS